MSPIICACLFKFCTFFRSRFTIAWALRDGDRSRSRGHDNDKPRKAEVGVTSRGSCDTNTKFP